MSAARKRILPRKVDARINEHGSAMVMAIFVLVLLTTIGSALLFVSQNEIRMSGADTNSKVSFYLAEAGLEAARLTLFNTNLVDSFDDDLATAAADGTFDFNKDTIAATFGTDGKVNGFTNYGDDEPLVGPIAFGDGFYVAFLTNDVIDEAIDPLVDTNERVVLTGIGAGPNGSFEIVEAVVEIRDIVPPAPPAAVTLLGPNPVYNDGNANGKNYVGDDCDGSGIPGYYVPTLGTIGSAAEASAETGQLGNSNYESNGLSREDAIADLTDWTNEPALAAHGANIDPAWTDCEALVDMLEDIRENADVVCLPPAPCTWPASTADRIIYIDGDFDGGPGDGGLGLLVVTGSLNFHGNADWTGMIFVIGEGQYGVNGSGNGTKSGAVIIADIAGPDNVYGTSDDCTGGDGGFGSAGYDESGGGTSETIFCSTAIANSNPVTPYQVVEFRQH